MSHRNCSGLYNVNDECDACGFGMVAQLDDQPSRMLVDTAIGALSRMTHRGGVAADGLTGDGCGLLIRKPDVFLRNCASDAGIELRNHFAAGNIFLPRDPYAAAQCRQILVEELQHSGAQPAGWRELPTDDSVCGALARDTLPGISQLFVNAGVGQSEDDFALALFLARRRAEQRLREHADFYVTSLAPNAISYKGMVLPDKLATFYPDLQRSDLAASAILFHQRFSTNTMPRWPLAHPFRMLAHNGEINTIEGNRRWAQARSKVWKTPRFDIAEFDPVISMHGSDSQSADNMLELLVAGGASCCPHLGVEPGNDHTQVCNHAIAYRLPSEFRPTMGKYQITCYQVLVKNTLIAKFMTERFYYFVLVLASI